MNGLLYEKTLDMLRKAKNGDKNAQDILVEENLGLVWSIVRRFQNRGHEPEDLFQIGSIGLIKAIKKFDESFNVKLSTYAVPMIMGEIKRFLRDDGIIKVSRSLKEMASKICAVKEELTKEHGREPTITEISSKLNIPKDDIVMALESTYSPESLHSTIGKGDDNSSLLIDKIDQSTIEQSMDIVDRLVLREVLRTLDGKERDIIIMRYFKEKTQTQIAKVLGISQVQVSRIEKKILKNLRQKICST